MRSSKDTESVAGKTEKSEVWGLGGLKVSCPRF